MLLQCDGLSEFDRYFEMGFSALLGCPKEFGVCYGNSKMMDCQMGKMYPIYKLVVKLYCFSIATQLLVHSAENLADLVQFFYILHSSWHNQCKNHTFSRP